MAWEFKIDELPESLNFICNQRPATQAVECKTLVLLRKTHLGFISNLICVKAFDGEQLPQPSSPIYRGKKGSHYRAVIEEPEGKLLAYVHHFVQLI